MTEPAKTTHHRCWICNQRATHVMTRPGSITLHACDHHTRIDRDEAVARGWTVEAIRTINWPSREEWQAKAERAERTSCFTRQRVSSDPADWLTPDELIEGKKAAAKLVRPARIALGKADQVHERYTLNQYYRDAAEEDADVDAVASGWWQVARIARSVDILPDLADRLTALSERMRQARDTAAETAEEAAVAKVIAARASDEGWAKKLQRRARIERGPQLTTITIHEDGTSTVSGPVPYQPPRPRA